MTKVNAKKRGRMDSHGLLRESLLDFFNDMVNVNCKFDDGLL
jgi:hypothetical protein